MKQLTRRSIIAAAPATLALGALPRSAGAAKKYGPGVTDKSIKIGNTCFYSGPASSYGTIGRAMAAYYKMVNDQGGVNGRMIDFLSYDDAYSPPKTVEMTRKMVEQDHVFLDAGPLGTPTNSAIWHYMNQKKVPQLFVSTGASKWNDPKGHPWTIGWQPNYHSEGLIYAAYILKQNPKAKVAVLYQDDDFGKDYLRGVSDGLAKARLKIAVAASYETTDTTVDSQVIAMKSAGCNAFVNTAIPKFAAQAIKKAAEIEWKPVHVLSSIGASVAATLKPAGFENAKGTVSDFYLKDPTDPQWKDDAGYKWWVGFMDKYYPKGDKTDVNNVYGPSNAATVVQALKQCGDNLTRENVMRQAANLHNFKLPMLLPGITINTSPTDFAPVKQVQMARFDGERWRLFGPLLTGAVG
ncbi:MAG TPA: ABC transporter substrate-binding protein [Stellaceae bacterium]|nr:ABC transporter substrate-binding protein [Stellaceae bacterium]